MLLAAAICSAPPTLVPELTQAAAAELDELRAACDAAVADLLRCRASRLVVVAAGRSTRTFAADAPAGWHRLGVDIDVPPLGRVVSRGERLPLALTVGRWLLNRAAGRADSWCTLDVAGAPSWGQDLAASSVGTALLVLGEGSAAVGPHAPMPQDSRAPAFDAAVAAAIGSGDVAALVAIDPLVGAELGATGVAPWLALAAAVGARTVQAELSTYCAPYGVGYLVGSWRIQ